ncbi:MAG: cytochrome c1, partial [Gammaproteobacteria bacterium]
MRICTLLVLLAVAAPTMAAEGDTIYHMKVNLSDKASLRRGARTFVNYCLSCHSASFMRYNRMGRD